MSVGSSGLFVAVWMAVAGLGTGIAMATAMSAALVELSEEKSGVGSGVMQAVNKTGGPLGIAILGSVLSAGYLSRLDLSGLPRPLRPPLSARASSAAWRLPASSTHRASRLCPTSIRAWDGHGTPGLRRRRCGWRCPHRCLPASDECHEEAADTGSGREGEGVGDRPVTTDKAA